MRVHVCGGRIGNLGSQCCVWGPVAMGNEEGLIYRVKDVVPLPSRLSLPLALFLNTTKAHGNNEKIGREILCEFIVCVCVQCFVHFSPDRG